MNKSQAKRDACEIVARLIDNYLDVGQPGASCQEGRDWKPEDEPRLTAAFEALRDELDRRSGK